MSDIVLRAGYTPLNKLSLNDFGAYTLYVGGIDNKQGNKENTLSLQSERERRNKFGRNL